MENRIICEKLRRIFLKNYMIVNYFFLFRILVFYVKNILFISYFKIMMIYF